MARMVNFGRGQQGYERKGLTLFQSVPESSFRTPSRLASSFRLGKRTRAARTQAAVRDIGTPHHYNRCYPPSVRLFSSSSEPEPPSLTIPGKLRYITSSMERITTTASEIYLSRPSAEDSEAASSSSKLTASPSLPGLVELLSRESESLEMDLSVLKVGSEASIKAMRNLSKMQGLLADFEAWRDAVEDAGAGERGVRAVRAKRAGVEVGRDANEASWCRSR